MAKPRERIDFTKHRDKLIARGVNERDVDCQVMEDISQQNRAAIERAIHMGIYEGGEFFYAREPAPAGVDPVEWKREATISQMERYMRHEDMFLSHPGMWEKIWAEEDVGADPHEGGRPEDYEDYGADPHAGGQPEDYEDDLPVIPATSIKPPRP